jgi:hypothetical protein
MKNLYQTAKRYAVPVLTGLALSLSGCEDKLSSSRAELPIDQEVRTALIQRQAEAQAKATNEFYNKVQEGRSLFNEGISDGYFSLQEQMETYKTLDQAKRIAKDTELNVEMPEQEKHLYNLFGSHGKLKQELKSKGIDIETDYLAKGLVILLSGIGSSATSLLMHRLYREDKNK